MFLKLDQFHETGICIKLFKFLFNMHSNIYSCLFCAANIKQENIIDSHAAWTEVNVVTSLQIKEWECKTHLLFVSDLNIYRKMKLCYNKKAQSLLRLLGGLRQACNEWMNKTLNIISKHLYCN